MEAALAGPLAAEPPSTINVTQDACTATLSVPEMMCGSCIRTIEAALNTVPGVSAARANLSSRRVVVAYDAERTSVPQLTAKLKDAGFTAAELADGVEPAGSTRASELIPRVGVAGFAAANIMLLSVSVWSGETSDMDASVKTLFHWLSAVIALPAIAYSAQPFFKSALAALRGGRLNMDVPISLGITLATAMSLFQTMRGTHHVYFDAATMLVFFLLIGRTLDERMRARARGAAENLLSLTATNASVVFNDGATRIVSARQLIPGMRIATAAGERIAADGIVRSGASDIDESLITGETLPRRVAPGDRVHAGTVNGGGPLQIEVTSAADNTLLADIGRMMIAAEQSRGRYVRLADRAARLYAPAVHLLGLMTVVGWMIAGAGWEQALTNAIAVLIITCPCALALAIPAVQVAATSRLFNRGVIVKAADGLERLAEVDAIVFDKTGTLTLDAMTLAPDQKIDRDVLARAAALATASQHPYARALVRAATDAGIDVKLPEGVREIPGSGLSLTTPGGEERLGSAAFVGANTSNGVASLWYARPLEPAIGFHFVDRLKADARDTVATLRAAGYQIELLSGDRNAAVTRAAKESSIAQWRGEVRPDQKLQRLSELKAAGRQVLMVGDGLNDAPALAAGHASISPASAVHVSQTAADAVFQGDLLAPIIETLKVAQASRRLALQNLGIALAYNIAFVPLAVLGHVTPLIAAIAMSTSSIAVTANAIRLRTMQLRAPQARRAP